MPAQAPTSVISVQITTGVAAGWTLGKGAYIQTGVGINNIWSAAKLGWIQKGAGVNNTWEIRYSTPTCAASNCSGSNSGTPSSGTVTSGTPGASDGGFNSGSLVYHWTYSSGDASIACSNAAIQNPTFSATVASGSPKSAVWSFYTTDPNTGAVSNTVFITISLTYTQTFVPITVTWGGLSTTQTGNGATSSFNVNTTCFPSGGNGVYSYAWIYISGDATITCSNAAIQSPNFLATVSAPAHDTGFKDAVWQVTVTDSIGSPSGSVQNTIDLEYQRGT